MLEHPRRRSLAEQPDDVISACGALLASVMAPTHLCALSSTCKATSRALALAVHTLRVEHSLALTVLTKCGSSFAKLAPSEEFLAEGIDWSGKGLSSADCEILARLWGDGALLGLKWLYLTDNRIGDAGLCAIAAACRKTGALAGLRMLNLKNNCVCEAGTNALADVRLLIG